MLHTNGQLSLEGLDMQAESDRGTSHWPHPPHSDFRTRIQEAELWGAHAGGLFLLLA